MTAIQSVEARAHPKPQPLPSGRVRLRETVSRALQPVGNAVNPGGRGWEAVPEETGTSAATVFFIYP